MSPFSRNLMIAANALFVAALVLASAWPEHNRRRTSDSSRQGPSQTADDEMQSVRWPINGDDAGSTIDLATAKLLLCGNPTTQPVITCPASNADKWDFGGGANTKLSWRSSHEEIEAAVKLLEYKYKVPSTTSN